MKAKILLSISVLALGGTAMTLTSCDTATGQGAGWGAATGAVLGAAATGRWEGAATGAAIGAGTGALIGAAVDEAHANRYGPVPRGGYPYGRRMGNGFYQSPYPPNQVYDLRGVPHGGLVDDRAGGGYFRKP
jgi:hypothetical protein